jgi:hypothetical protein
MTAMSPLTLLTTLGARRQRGAGLRGRQARDFSGWVFKPGTVKDYVSFYNQKHAG